MNIAEISEEVKEAVTGKTVIWKIDPTHSRLIFFAHHLGISKVPGWFNEYDTEIKVGESGNFLDAEVTLNVKVSSIDTGNEYRDKHIKGKEFLDSENYPLIRFESKSTNPIDADKLKLTGELTVKGTTREETFEVLYGGMILSEKDQIRAGFRINGNFNRFDYGLDWNEMDGDTPVLGKTVDLLFCIELMTKKKQSLAEL